MALAMHLRVTSPLLAIPTASRHGFVTIPVGSIIEMCDVLAEPGFHPVKFNGQELLVFARDIRERTQTIDMKRAS